MTRLRRQRSMGFLLAVIAAAPLLAQDDPFDDAFVTAFLRSDIQLNPIVSYTASEAQIYTAIYEGLVGYHPLTMEPQAAAARDWTVSDDGRTYTFNLRRGLRFSNGDRLTARDFRETWLRLIDPSMEAAYNFLFDIIAGVREYRADPSAGTDAIGIEARDDWTLVVTLRQPATHFLRILCHHAFVPVHESLRNESDWPIGTPLPGNGPYRLVEQSDDELRLVRNERYWDAANVEIPALRILFVDEDDALVAERFNSGEIDWMTTAIFLEEIADTRAIVVNPLFATTYYFIRSDDGALANGDVRRALALLLPWEQIRDPETLFIPARGLVPPIPYYPDVEGIVSRDTEGALELLADAGFPGGRGIGELVLHIPVGEEPDRVASIMAEAWRSALDVEVTIRRTPYPGYFNALGATDYAVGTVSWIGDFADPLTFLQMWISDSNVNDARFSNAEYDRLIDESMRTQGVQRYELLAQAEEILLATGTVLPVSHSPAINIIDLEAVEGWYPNPLDIHPFKHLRFGTPRLSPGMIRFDAP